MRKLLIGFVTLIILAVAGVLIGPSFIDWNTYKSDITAQVKSLTGRDMVIGGDIKIAVLPSPAVVANEVTFANIEGGSEPHMAELGSLAVNVALGPLLGGEIQVTKVRIENPVVVLEVLADGRQNWVFEAFDEKSSASALSSETSSTSIDLSTGQSVSDATQASGPALQLDNFEIVNGTIVYRDARTATEERAEALNATLKAASLNGPFESIGSLKIRNIPIAYEIGIDGVFQGRTVPINAKISSPQADASVILQGNVVNLSEDAKFTGKLKAEGQSLAAVINAVSGAEGLPGGVNQPFSADGDVTATASNIDIGTLALKLGDASATGIVTAGLGDMLSAAAEFNINHVNLDTFLAMQPFTAQTEGGEGEAESAASSVSGSVGGNDAASLATVSGAAENFTIPDNISASLALGIDAMTYQGEKAGPVRLNAELSSGEITLSQFTAQLPGTTDVALFGFMSAQDEGPVFDGELEVSIGDTRRLSSWLQLDMPKLPNGRLRHITAMGKLKVTPKNIQVSGIDVGFDRSRLNGGITIALRKRPAFGASIVLDQIDLDGYLPVMDSGSADAIQPGASGKVAEDGGSAGAGSEATSTGDAAANPLAVLNALTRFDANLIASVGEVVHQGVQIKDIAFDGTLFSGDLKIKKASVANLAGAAASVSGTVSELGGNPRFDGLEADFKAKSVEKLAGLLGVELPVSAKALGAVSTSAKFDGPMLQPTIKANLSAAGGKATFDGGISLLPLKDLVDGAVTLKHGDLVKLLRSFGVDYTPSGNIGGLDVAANVSGGADDISLEGLSGSLGKVAFNGSTRVRLDGPVPKVIADLTTNEFIVDPFIPAGKNTALAPRSFGVTPRPVLTSGAPWSDDPLDLSALNSLNGDFRVRSDAIIYDSYRLENADIIASLTNGVLKADRVTGSLFGGRVNVKGLVNAQGLPSADATLSFENASISNMLSSLIGKPSAAGAFTFETSLKASGASVADMVSALDGNGSFLLKGLDVQGSAKGTPFAGILGLVQSFGQIGAGLSGQPGDGLADATGSFVVSRGVAQIGDFRLASGFGNGSAAGSVDLANWQMDVSGVMKLAQNILSQLLVQKAGAPQELPFRITGALDSPTVKLETASLGAGGGVPLPGLEKLDEKLPGASGILQGVLGGVLGGGTTTQQQQTPPPQPEAQTQTEEGLPVPQSQPQQQPQPEPQQIQPQDILKQILKF